MLHPDLLERVRAGDDELLEQGANESIRMAQRSITLRQGVKPMTFTVADQAYDLAPGVLVATMLSNTNTTAGLDLDHYVLTPSFASVAPRSRRIGGVARAAKPCWCDCRAR